MVRFWRYIRQIRHLTRDLSCYISHRIFVEVYKFAIFFSNLPLSKGSSFTSHRLFHLCPEMHAMAKMAKNRQRTGDSNWIPKVAPSNLITKEVPITVREMFAIFAITCISGHISNVRKNRWHIFRHYTCSFCHIPQVIVSSQC